MAVSTLREELLTGYNVTNKGAHSAKPFFPCSGGGT
jgi:hypothetical protein